MRATNERGTALLTAMIAVFVISAMIASLFNLVVSDSDESEARVRRTKVHVSAEAGAERMVAQLFRATINEDRTGLQPPAGSGWHYLKGDDGDGSYYVHLEYLPHVAPSSGYGFMHMAITSLAMDPDTKQRHGMNAVVETEFAIDVTKLKPIPAVCVATSGLTGKGSKWLIDGSNREHSTFTPDGPQLNEDAQIQMDVTEIPSSAGWKSDFYVQPYGKDPVLVVAGVNHSNHPEPVLSEVFGKGDVLNFFIHVHSGVGPDYNHYAFPRPDHIDPVTGDDPLHSFTGWNEPNPDWWGHSKPRYLDSRPYCRVEQISDTQYKLFFEDMPGEIADWDNGEPGDLYHKADQNVTVTIVPSDEPPGHEEDLWAMLPGVPAVSYDGEYSDFGLSDSTDQLRYMDDDSVTQVGVGAHTTDTVPVLEYRSELLDNQTVHQTVEGRTFTNEDFGTFEKPLVTHIVGDAKLAGNWEGHGILIVDGDLALTGVHSFNGLVIATGDITVKGGAAGEARISGAMFAGGTVNMSANGRMLYNWETIYKALGAAGNADDILDTLENLLEPDVIFDVESVVWAEMDDGQVGAFLKTATASDEVKAVMGPDRFDR